jgi:hypothetical protein
MPDLVPPICPYLGLSDNGAEAEPAYLCYAQTPPARPGEEHRNSFCPTPEHLKCPLHLQPAEAEPPPPAPAVLLPADDEAGPSGWLRWVWVIPLAVLAIAIIVVAVVYGRDLSGPSFALPDFGGLIAETGRLGPGAAVQPRAAFEVTTLAPAVVPITATSSPTASPTATATSTIEPGGQILTISPGPGDAGWWATGETRGNLGDSYLYAGYFGGQAFASIMQLDLREAAPGAPVRDGKLYLTGLQAERFNGAGGGTWLVQMLPTQELTNLAMADFQALFNAPAAVTLFPALYPGDLVPGQVNTFALDEAGRDWLGNQIAEGNGSVLVRILGPAGGEDTLFAWDSGAGPLTSGQPPRLVLSVGAPPAEPPPTPTEPILVATLTPTPANVLTLAAQLYTATAAARRAQTSTSTPFIVETPTALPANQATAWVHAAAQGLPAVVVPTGKPSNASTATRAAVQATAVAMTTGTYTPVPPNAVTPMLILPTDAPEDIVSLSQQLMTATAQATQIGTSTPVPYSADIATITPSPPVITFTPTPANPATATRAAAVATAVAMTTGTFTPMPENARTPTYTPTATPLPLVMWITPAPTFTPTPIPPETMARNLIGWILFLSDRGGPSSYYALDPKSGQLYAVTREWPYLLAQLRERRSPDGRFDVLVQEDGKGKPQLVISEPYYNITRALTSGGKGSWDPAWSPRGDAIAYVSGDSGSDEIYTMNLDGTNVQRLTNNSWEWDEHPSWSPDGSQIVFWSNRASGRKQLWIMNADGSNQHPLLVSSYDDWDPIWVR